MGRKGCRKIADDFNNLHAAKSACTVSKTFVAECLKANQYALACLQTLVNKRSWTILG